VDSVVINSLFAQEDLKNYHIELIPSMKEDDHIEVDIIVSGTLDDMPVEVSRSVDINLNKKMCDRCSKISGGYFQGIVQVRGDSRSLENYEMEKIRRISTDISRRMLESERMAFILNIEEIDEGIDIYTGITELARKISKNITEEFGGSYSESASLIGMEDGQEVYKVSFSVRLPSFKVGDIISIGRRTMGVKSVGSHVSLVNLETNDNVSYGWKYLKDKDVEVLGNIKDSKKGLISMIDKGEVQIVDMLDYDNFKLRKPDFLNKNKEGEEIYFVKEDRIYLIPEQFSKLKNSNE